MLFGTADVDNLRRLPATALPERSSGDKDREASERGLEPTFGDRLLTLALDAVPPLYGSVMARRLARPNGWHHVSNCYVTCVTDNWVYIPRCSGGVRASVSIMALTSNMPLETTVVGAKSISIVGAI